MTHDDLVRCAERWLLKSMNGAYVLTDHLRSQLNEAPDAIGFKPHHGQSLLVEVKVSRADFLADPRPGEREHAARLSRPERRGRASARR